MLSRKNGDKINIAELSRELGCRVVEISALKGDGSYARLPKRQSTPQRTQRPFRCTAFSGVVEHAIAHIEEAAVHDMPEEQQRWYAIKIFERDEQGSWNSLTLDRTVIDTH